MPDELNEDGLQVKTLEEIRTELVDDLKLIYGDDINVAPNSQDGQQLNIYAQGGVDLREVLNQVNANFDPDQAKGRILDQRVALNGITRNGGTYTLTPVEIITDDAVNLVGLDDQSDELNPTVPDLYTVKDDAGTEFYLLDSESIVGAGTQDLTFRAAKIGEVEVQLNTITEPVTVLAGITGINNPAGALSAGVNEESDPNLKVRRRGSVSIPSLGFLDGIEASLANLNGVSVARVYENDANATDSDGTEAHTIWAIVEGGSDADIADIIYRKKSSGSGMRGAEEVEITRPDNRLFTAKFDRPGSEDLHIRFTLALIGGGFIDKDSIKTKIVEDLFWQIGSDAGGDDVTDFLKGLNDQYRVTGMQVSDDGASWFEVVSVTSPKNRFVNDTANITIT
jgi:uncharacterized phage protein gp47/JayE